VTVELPERAAAMVADLQFACDAALDNSRAANNRLQTFGAQLDEQTKDRFLARRDEQQRQHQDLHLLISRIKKWQASLPAKMMLEPCPVEAKPKSGETIADAISRTRADLAKSQLELISSKNAPSPKSELKTAAREQVSRLARGAAPWLDARGAKLFNFGDPRSAITFVERDQAFAMLCWFDPDRAVAKLEALVDALPTPQGAMTVAEKAKSVAALTVKIEQFEREEEALIEAAIAQGQDMMRRPNASPAAVLGVVAKEKPIEEDFEDAEFEDEEADDEAA
jgi:hypothetical protein